MFVHTDVPEIRNPFSMIGKEMLLVSAGNRDSWNTMTASWGTMGVLWNKNVISVVIRPQRYTYEFFEREDYFTVTVLRPGMEQAYRICGTKSGRDCDKAALAGITPYFKENAITFEEARLVFVCKKIYVQDLDPEGFLDPHIDSHYPTKDYHRLYCGEVVDVLEQK
ncbi:MAG: flavin reductase family protein [Clostridia bacterium]|nr:flavin reductase family protein [Clostridia bacterium]